ncbi:MAG: GDSL-type esterase/lipase family protein [Acidobacteriota bacterium]
MPASRPATERPTDAATFIERRPRVTNALVAVAATLAFLLVAEATLWLAGFRFLLRPEDIEFGQPNPVVMKRVFEPDPDLLWVHRQYGDVLATLRQESPDLLVLGDSCTHLGTYDDRLVERAAARGVDLAIGNLAVAGWSSFQGRRQVERDVADLGARVATIYFGWNDHWVGFGIEDAQIARLERFGQSAWGRLRLVQLALKVRVVALARAAGWPRRVPLDDFADNLRQMTRRLEELGVRPMILTAPTSHRPGHVRESLEGRFVRDLDEVIPLHRSYADAARQVAAEEDVPLCDLLARFDALPVEERDRSFQRDGIHATPLGDQRIAAMLDRCFADAGYWPLLSAGR